MRYDARLPANEREWLLSLVGRPLQAVRTDGWAAELESDAGPGGLRPQEVRTPDEDHPFAVVCRPAVHIPKAPAAGNRMRQVGADLGQVAAVLVHSTCVTFTDPEEVPETPLDNGAVVPAGIRYRPRFRKPRSGPAEPEDPRHAVVDLDIAIELRTADHRVLCFTNGAGLFLNVYVDGRPSPGWERRDEPVRQTRAIEL